MFVCFKNPVYFEMDRVRYCEGEFPITQAQCVMGDYNSSEQSIWPRPWEVTCHTQNTMLSHPLLIAKYHRINKHFPL